MARTLRAMQVTLYALGTLLCLAPPAFADTTSDLIKSLQLVAAPAPVKQRTDWRVPHKVPLEFGRQDWAPRQASPMCSSRPISRRARIWPAKAAGSWPAKTSGGTHSASGC
jgi:hypothetical protein